MTENERLWDSFKVIRALRAAQENEGKKYEKLCNTRRQRTFQTGEEFRIS